jgi:hypothetical protein
MATALTLLLLLADEPKLTPSVDLQARLAALEAQRALLEAAHTRSVALKVCALGAAVLALASVAWGIIELVLVSNIAKAAPLSGVPYRAPVPPGVMFGSGVVLGLGGIALQVAGRVVEVSAAEDEEDLDSQERVLRRVIAGDDAP